jgi:ribonuclease E
MTRKRVGQGLLEAFSETCDHCNGRGIIVHMDPVEPHGRKTAERSTAVVERIDRVTGEHAHSHGHAHDEHGGSGDASERQGSTGGGNEARHASSAVESRASRRRRRKGKHHEGDEAPGTPVDSAWDSDADAGSDADAPAVSARPVVNSATQTASAAEADAAPMVQAAPINLKAHADDPDAAAGGDELGEALVDTGRPRKRRRAASRPAGSPQSNAEAS